MLHPSALVCLLNLSYSVLFADVKVSRCVAFLVLLYRSSREKLKKESLAYREIDKHPTKEKDGQGQENDHGRIPGLISRGDFAHGTQGACRR
jgi:hypothetical protein